MFATRRRSTALALGVIALIAIGGAAHAGGADDDLTACLTPRGRLVKVDEGTSPLRACRPNQTEVQWPTTASHDALVARIAALEAVMMPGVYSGPLDTEFVSPGEFDAVKSPCELGDLAVSGSVVVFADDFRMVSSHLVIDGATGVHNWAFGGVNAGSDEAEIRVAAICLDVTP